QLAAAAFPFRTDGTKQRAIRGANEKEAVTEAVRDKKRTFLAVHVHTQGTLERKRVVAADEAKEIAIQIENSNAVGVAAVGVQGVLTHEKLVAFFVERHSGWSNELSNAATFRPKRATFANCAISTIEHCREQANSAI